MTRRTKTSAVSGGRERPRRALSADDFSAEDRARFWDSARKTSECWLWTGLIGRPGRYGVFMVGNQRYYAHRVAYVLEYETDPRGAQVMHSCDVKHCVRPDHLVLGTVRERVALQRARGRRPTGAEHPSSRFTWEAVREMRRLSLEGWSLPRLAKKFRSTAQALALIVRGERYKDPAYGRRSLLIGYKAAGEENPHAKLTWAQVDRIRALYASGEHGPTALGRLFGVGPSNIHRIVSGAAWKRR